MKIQITPITKAVIMSLMCLSANLAMAQNQVINFAGCTEGKFVIGTANNQITTAGANYTPKCLKVKKGATVSIAATDRHPLVAAPSINNAVNPFASEALFNTTQTRVMDTVGAFGYYCDAHGDAEGDGMAGLIVVEE